MNILKKYEDDRPSDVIFTDISFNINSEQQEPKAELQKTTNSIMVNNNISDISGKINTICIIINNDINNNKKIIKDIIDINNLNIEIDITKL